MTRTQTYGERMAKWEEENDRRNWQNSFERALENKNYEDIKVLVSEAFDCGYTIPNVTDSKAQSIISNCLSKK